MLKSRDTDQPNEVARQKLGLAVETLSNIHYLIGLSPGEPDLVKTYLEMAESALDTLRALALDRGWAPQSDSQQHHRLFSSGQTTDHTDPLPLAAASEENIPSQDDVPLENRIAEPEAE
jgi:hypothetical protein